jgi:hypothetical protein
MQIDQDSFFCPTGRVIAPRPNANPGASYESPRKENCREVRAPRQVLLANKTPRPDQASPQKLASSKREHVLFGSGNRQSASGGQLCDLLGALPESHRRFDPKENGPGLRGPGPVY